MLIELLFSLIFYKLIRFFFGKSNNSNDDVFDIETSNFNAIFAVATRLEKLYGGKAYVGLRIPDADSGSRQNIDLVLVTEREAVVISLKYLAGFVTVNSDGSWLCISEHRHKEEHHPDPLAGARSQASVLEAYLEQRGVSLPEGYLSFKVIISNPKFQTLYPGHFPPEIIQHDQRVHLKPESKGMFSWWMNWAVGAAKKDMQESTQEQLQFVLSTAPMWDRLELKGRKYVLGEFVEFKGESDDIQEFQTIERSKVGQMVVQETPLFGSTPARLQVSYSFRNYRTEGTSSSERKKVTISSSTEVIFQPQNCKKVRKFKLSAVTSLTLSA